MDVKTEILKACITYRGFNQKQFSLAAGIPYTTLRSILIRGVENASVDNIIKICKALNSTVEALTEEMYGGGELVARIIEDKGFSVAQVSEESHIPEELLEKILNGAEPLLQMAVSILSEVLDITWPEALNAHGFHEEYIPPHFEGNINHFEAFRAAVDADALSEIDARNIVLGQLVFTADFQRLVKAYNAINMEGQSRVADYAEDLDQSGRYQRSNDSATFQDDFGQYITAIGTAAAGSGFEYGDDFEQYKLITTVDVPAHDFAITVQGDSMFPTIFDQDIAFVVKNYEQVDKDIYLLDIDGETVIKRVVFGSDGHIELLSDNPEWKTRELSETEIANTRILGRIVGWESAV